MGPEIPVDKLAQALLQCSYLPLQLIKSRSRALDLTIEPKHLFLLRYISSQPKTVGELADFVNVSAPTMSTVINTLVKRGWLERQRSLADRRVVQVTLTPAGEEILAQAQRHMVTILAAALEPLSAPDRQLLKDGLDLLQQAMSQALPGTDAC